MRMGLLRSKNFDYWVYYNHTGCCSGYAGAGYCILLCDGEVFEVVEGARMLEAIVYVVEQIDGDYANLRRVDEPDSELKVVARALLPESIEEGSRLKYEMFQYSIEEG